MCRCQILASLMLTHTLRIRGNVVQAAVQSPGKACKAPAQRRGLIDVLYGGLTKGSSRKSLQLRLPFRKRAAQENPICPVVPRVTSRQQVICGRQAISQHVRYDHDTSVEFITGLQRA